MDNSVKEETFESLETHLKNPHLPLNWSSVFVLPGFIRSWWQVFAPGVTRLFLRSVWKDGKIIGLVPLQVSGSKASFIGHKDVFDYIDFVIVPGFEGDFYRILLADLQSQGIDELDLGPLRPDATVLTSLMEIARTGNLKPDIVPEDIFIELPLPSTWDDYLEGLEGKNRHELRRKIRRLMGAGNVDFRIISDPAGINSVEDTFFRLFALSRGDKGAFMTDTMSRFFHTLTKSMTENGTMRFGVLQLEKKVISMVLCFEYKEGVYLYNSAFDPSFSDLSPGLVTKAFYIQDAIARKKRVFDFLKGSEAYKYRMGGRETAIYRVAIRLK
jgi:CelD/BcsL family acetyltransferase involved in cellulose biosynthesis